MCVVLLGLEVLGWEDTQRVFPRKVGGLVRVGLGGEEEVGVSAGMKSELSKSKKKKRQKDSRAENRSGTGK